MTKAVVIDVRAATAMGNPIRIIATTLITDGKVLISKTGDYHEPLSPKEGVLIVTDTPDYPSHWGLCYHEKQHTAELIDCYRQIKSTGRLMIGDSVRQYDPADVLQAVKMDARGQVYEFDQGITCGHLAVLMAIWAAKTIYTGAIISDDQVAHSVTDQAEDDYMTPFSI